VKFSIVIPYSQDYPHVWFTLQDKYLRLMENYDSSEYEVIIVENGSSGENLRLVRRMCGKQGDNPDEWYDRQSSWGSPRRLNLRYVEIKKALYPTRPESPTQLHSKPAINVGAWKAKGKYLVFADSHTLFNNDWFTLAEKHMEENESCTILHTSLSWHCRDYQRRGYQYNLTFKDGCKNFWGNWSSHKVDDKPYPIAASGWAGVVARRKVFIDRYKGFPSMLRSYGAGEPYMDILAWMMGDEVHLHPDMHTVHFSLARSRGYHQGGAIIMNRNKMLAAYIIGGDEWALWCRDNAIAEEEKRHRDWTQKFMENYILVKKWGRFRRRMVEEEAVYTLEETLRLFKDRKIYH